MSIRTSIELQDNFTGILYHVIDSVNLGLSAMEDLRQTMNSPVDIASLEGARDSIHLATAAVRELDAAMQGMETPAVQSPAAVTSSVPVNIPVQPVVPDPLVEPPEPVQVPVEWQSYEGLDVFTNTGVERFEQEIASVNTMMERLSETQSRITQQANGSEIFSQQASNDIQNVENRVRELVGLISQAESNPLNIGTEEANTQFERLRMQLNHTLQIQNNLDTAMQGMDISEINAAYLRLSQNVTDAERLVRDSFSHIPPVEIPVHWNSDTMPVFTNSGVERFEQEVQSANSMLNTLNQTQTRIAQTAAQTDLLPENAVTDINAMQNRLQMIRQQIQVIENHPVNLGSHTANTELERLRGQLNQAVQEQEVLNRAIGDMNVQAANEAYLRLSQTIAGTERYLRDNVSEQGRFNQEVRNLQAPISQAESGFKGWQRAIITANQALSFVRNTLGRLGVLDITGAFSRIDTMERFQRIITIMTGDSEQARAALAKLKDMTVGTAYGLDTAAKATQGFLTRGMSLGTAVDQVRIWSDAVSFYGKGTTEQLENVMDAVGKIYSKGTVEAMQIDRLFEAGIGAAEMYAQAVGRTVGEVKKDLTDRKISSGEFLSVVTQALDQGVSSGAAKDAGNTWATTFANVGAAVHRGWVSVIQNIDKSLAAHGLPSAMESIALFGQKAEAALNDVGSAVGIIVDFAVVGGQMIGNAADFITDHWAWISPVVYGVAAAIAAYTACLVAYNIIVGIAKIRTMLLHAQLFLIVGAVTVGIVALFNFCNWIAQTTGIAESGFGVICGAATFMAAAIFNIIVGLINGALQIVWNFALPFIQIVEWVLNVANGGFDSFGDAVANLIGQIISWFLSLGKIVTKIIDAVFGTDWTEGLTSLQDTVTSWGKNETAITFNREAPEIPRIDYGDAFRVGADWGDGVSAKISGMITGFTDQFRREREEEEDAKFDDLLGGVDDLVGNTNKIADNLDITKEDLKYLRDIAGRDSINTFTTAKISVKMNNKNTINKDMDLDGLSKGLRMRLEEEMSAAAEMAHV